MNRAFTSGLAYQDKIMANSLFQLLGQNLPTLQYEKKTSQNIIKHIHIFENAKHKNIIQKFVDLKQWTNISKSVFIAILVIT